MQGGGGACIYRYRDPLLCSPKLRPWRIHWLVYFQSRHRSNLLPSLSLFVSRERARRGRGACFGFTLMVPHLCCEARTELLCFAEPAGVFRSRAMTPPPKRCLSSLLSSLHSRPPDSGVCSHTSAGSWVEVWAITRAGGVQPAGLMRPQCRRWRRLRSTRMNY